MNKQKFDFYCVRFRTCTEPIPQSGGSYCTGAGVRFVSCATDILCPRTDNWSTWSSFSSCSVTCGTGIRTAYRNCTRAVPSVPGDRTCNGSSTRTTICDMGACPGKSIKTIRLCTHMIHVENEFQLMDHGATSLISHHAHRFVRLVFQQVAVTVSIRQVVD